MALPDPDRLTLAEAVERVMQRCGVSEDKAKAWLHRALMDGVNNSFKSQALRLNLRSADQLFFMKPLNWYKSEIVSWEDSQAKVRDKDGRLVHVHEVTLDTCELDRALPNAASKATKHKGGTPGKWEWACAVSATSGYFTNTSPQPSRLKANEFMKQWFINNSDDHPSDGDIRKYVKLVYEDLFSPDGN